MAPQWDVIVVGGGPAGLSAALLLGRCCRRVLLLDDRRPRNGPARAVNGLFTRDGTPPEELRRLGREQLRRYGVTLRRGTVTDARRTASGFELAVAGGESQPCRKLLLATGLADRLPEVPGLAELFGTSVFHCPVCDAWELRDQPLAILGGGRAAVEEALALTTWSADVVLCTDGAAQLRPIDRTALAAHRIPVREEKVVALRGEGGRLSEVVFATGSPLCRSALFFSARPVQRSELARSLGCTFDRRGVVETGKHGSTGVPGLRVAGDASRGLNLVAVAAAEGVKAAFALDRSLRLEASRARLAAHAGAGGASVSAPPPRR